MHISLEAVSNTLGLVSSAAWLGAQFPQLWTNYRLQSADGLALPFLANWLAGDSTNLIGCILTHQLPFQTYLAAYFVWVDTCLFVQYLYYERRKRSPSAPVLQVATEAAGPSAPLTASPTTTFHPLPGSTSSLPGSGLGANRSRMRSSSYRRQPLPLHDDLVDEPEEEHPAMTESIHSEHHRLVQEQRGRLLERAEEAKRRASQTSGRGASLVFLAVFGMWSVGFGNAGGENRFGRVGRVIGRPQPSYYAQNAVHPTLYFASVPTRAVQLQYNPPSPLALQYMANEDSTLPPTTPPPTLPPPEDGPDRDSWTWIIGRISAWTCSVLYLTSRMPQIWKNYTRQSVEGLSISLFVFAFMGNFFYVGSILTSSRMAGTPAERLQHLKDSFPFILGSGGTFIFDVVIVIQSFVYRGLHPVTSATAGQPRRRYASVIRAVEEDPLLGHSHRRSQSFGWPARRSVSTTRGRASLERYSRTKANANPSNKARASVERGYGAMQGSELQRGV